MKKQGTRLLSLLLSFVMVLGMLPAAAPHAHAEHVNGVTLTDSNGEVTPAAVLDNLVVYDIWTAEQYTLTTTPDNTYGVFFRTYYSREWIVDDWYDEGGYYDTDDVAEITLDNVTISTKNPRHTETAGDAVNRYGALTFWAADMEWKGKYLQGMEYMEIIVSVKGTNTVELLGAENDTADAKWSAVGFVNCAGSVIGSGSGATLNATIAYNNAVGAAAALSCTSGMMLSDADAAVTINAVAQVTGTDGTQYGNGIDIADYSLYCSGGTELNIVAGGTGILRRYIRYCDTMYFEDSTIRINAGKAAVISEGEPEPWTSNVHNHKLCKIYFTNCTVNADGIYNGGALVDPLDSGINAAHSIIFENTTAVINALDRAIDAAYDYGGNESYNHVSAEINVTENSHVTVTGSMGERKDPFSEECAAVDAGSYNSFIEVDTNSTLTVTAGWMAMIANYIRVLADGELYVTTTKPSDGGTFGCYDLYAGKANSNVAGSKPGKIRIDSAAQRLGAGQSKYLYSNDVLIHTAGGPPTHPDMVRHDTTLGDGIVLMESEDGVNWQPISTGRNSLETMRWLTTIPQSSHVCANDDPDQLTFDVATSTHSGPCLVCGQTFTHDCVLEDEIPAYTKHPDTTTDGVRYWDCLICEGRTPETVPAHECEDYSDNNWVLYEDEPGEYHVAYCTFTYGDGKLCGDAIVRAHEMTGEFHVDATTIRNECTVCDFFREDTGEASAVEFPAKEATCTAPGNVACWSCSHCGNYFADEACSIILTPGEVFTQPAAHSFGEDGICTACGYQQKTLSFVPEEGFPNDYEYYYVVLGKTSDGKLYAMGNDNNADGRREAVEIPAEMIAADGTVTLTSEMAEFLYFETVGSSNTAWMADGGCFTFTVQDGFFLYDKAHYGNKCVPYPGYFAPNYSSDEPGSFELYAHDKDYEEKVWVYFNEEDLCFDISTTQMKNIYLYIQLCEHPGLYHNEPADPTCTEQGTREYYGCGKCGTYYSDAAATVPYEFPDYVDPGSLHDVNQYFQLPALWHNFDDDGICVNCGMLRQVYKPVTSLEQFDALSEDAYYIIVFRDLEELASVPVIGGGEEGGEIPESVYPTADSEIGDDAPGGAFDFPHYSGKTFAAFLPDIEHRFDPCERDSDGDGLVDVMEADTDGNGIPDCIEVYIDTYWGADSDGDGTTTVAEYNEMIGDYTEDGVVNMDDYRIFFSDYVYWDMYYEYEDQDYAKPNIVEVTVAADGSITIVDEAAMEFQMMESGVWGGQEYYESAFEDYGIKDTERMRAAWVPNWWFANSGRMGGYYEEHFMTQNRWYGDGEIPGITDNKNWKIGFNEDGTVLLVSTWADFDDTAALQLVRYTDYDGNERMTIVGCYDEFWQYSDIMLNAVYSLPASLYASEPAYSVPPHECIWGPWQPDEYGRMHIRQCTVEGCGKKQSEVHAWDDGVRAVEPTCTEPGEILYTCPDCNATRTEEIPALDHDWSEWTYDSVDSHTRYCKRECGVEEEFGGHEWGDWVKVDDDTHKMTCDLCGGEQTDEHDWDNGVVTQEPTEWEEGVMTYTCGTCSHTRTEPIDKLEHECTWTDWYPDGDENHKRHCMDENCGQSETSPHEWDEGEITEEPTCDGKGVKTYTCQVCSHTKIEEIPENGHQYESTVVQAPNCTVEGLMTQYCPACGDTQEKTMPVDPDAHDWGEWSVTKVPAFGVSGVESRICRHNAAHVDHRDIGPVYCWHTCAACGGCSDKNCPSIPKCSCNVPNILPSEDSAISYIPNFIPPVDQIISIVATEVNLPSVTDNTVGQEVVNPYEEFILNNAEGMKVETVFEIGLVNEATGAAYELKEGESASVTLFVGPENAEAIEDGRMFLVHITNGTQITYGADKIVAELDGESYTGNITFTTDSFSPFVLVSLPGGLDITLNGVGATNSCTVFISANQAYNCSLYLAAYDINGKMLGVKVVDNCNLAANPQYTLEFSGTAAYVKAFMMEPDGGLTPRCASVTDDKLND